MKPRVWIVSELYYPEESATGYLLTRIAEGLAPYYRVHVLCAQPTYDARGIRAPIVECHQQVQIRRCVSTTLNKNFLLFRLLNVFTISVSIFFRGLITFRSDDVVLVVTNPPTLPFVTAAACRIRRSKYVLVIHDVFPEALTALGLARERSLLTRLMTWLNNTLYSHAQRVIVLGRDMRELVRRKNLRNDHRIVIVPNWADVDIVRPQPREENQLLKELRLQTKFVLLYAGNIGLSHGIDNLFRAAVLLAGDDDFHFLFVGSGTKKRWLEQSVADRGLRNITILPNRPRSDQNNFLNACDAVLISYHSGMAGVSVPSRMYNVLAAGKPIIAVTDSHSELARVVQEEDVGWVVRPDQPEALTAAIVDAKLRRRSTAAWIQRARTAAEKKYTLTHTIDQYRAVVDSVLSGHSA